MLATHAVPSANVFSFVEPTHPWLMHAGGSSDRSMRSPFRPVFGPAVFSAIALGTMMLALSLLAAGTIGRARHAWVGLVLFLAAVAFFGARFLSARPTGVAGIFPIAIALVAFERRFEAWSIAIVTVVELVWANAHGSFPLGIVIMLVAAADRRESRPLRVAAAGAMALATFATPYGVALHRFVWGYFRGTEGIYRLINLHIKEFGTFFRGTWGSTVGPVELVALVLFVAAAAGAAAHRAYRARALFCLSLFALSLLHARHFELAGLLSCLLLVPYLDALAGRSGPPAPAPPPRAIAAFVLLPAYVIGVGAFGWTAARRPAADEWASGGLGLVRSIAALPDGARAVVPFPTAGIAIWYGFPRGVRVFFDSRNDCYSTQAFAAFWSLETNAPPEVRRAILFDVKADAALLPEGSTRSRRSSLRSRDGPSAERTIAFGCSSARGDRRRTRRNVPPEIEHRDRRPRRGERAQRPWRALERNAKRARPGEGVSARRRASGDSTAE